MAKTFPKPKDPDAVLDYEWDWAPFLAEGDPIATSVFTVVEGTCTTGARPDEKTDTTTTVWVSGGEPGEECHITNHIITAAGREDDLTGIIKIKEK